MWCWAEEKTNKEREGNDWHQHGGLDVALSAHHGRGVEASNVPGDLVATARESMASLVACATLASVRVSVAPFSPHHAGNPACPTGGVDVRRCCREVLPIIASLWLSFRVLHRVSW